MTVIGDRNHVVTMRVPCKAMQVPLRPKVSPLGLWRLVSPVSLVRMGHSFSFTDKSLIVVRGSLAGHLGAEPLGPKTYLYSIAGSVGQCLGVFKNVLKLQSHTVHTFLGRKRWFVVNQKRFHLVCGKPNTHWRKVYCTAVQSGNVIKMGRECYPMRIKSRMLSDANPVASIWDSTNNGYQLKSEDKHREENLSEIFRRG